MSEIDGVNSFFLGRGGVAPLPRFAILVLANKVCNYPKERGTKPGHRF